MISPETMTLVLILYLLLSGFSRIMLGACKKERSTTFNIDDVGIGIVVVIAGIILLMI